ncbi:MAG: hypothetical protein ABIK98_10310 [Pseudomonadota bacterium]|uniref:MORN repeat protein n=1 Tax=Candidatus Desulfatibia profunda TaxID=2841695 RepID=A0A8J6TJN3_9BACT|nr:hypothetical protein [Candidatus Desulfatibia profunda]MBL7181357.1 hypothetical protein [Desulfobacterales bacterium]
MGLLSKKFYIPFLLTAVFLCPFHARADDLNQKIERIVKDFRQQIGDIDSSKDYVIVVRTFFDKNTKKPSKRSEKIKDTVFRMIGDEYLGKSKVAVLNWRSEKPLEIKDSSGADEICYKQGLWEKRLVEDFGKGFLVTGTTAATAEFVEIYAELIDLTTGKVLTSSKENLPLGSDDIVPAQETLPSEQPEAGEPGQAQKTPPSQQLTPAEAAPAATAAPSEITAAPQALEKEMPSKDELKDLEYKVIEGDNFKYEGYVKDGQKHGQGTLFYQSGDKYIGQWQNDQKHGRGTYYFKNGDTWEGTYVNDKKHGRGVYTWANGKSQEEVWENGELVK